MQGKVYLIGAGCGDASLITIKGLQKLLEADVVLYDSLLDESLISKLSEKTEKIFVGKRYNKKSTPQDEINKILVEKAQEGKIIARLKGGDPFVFGRGAEEALALEKNNIEYEVISGISSAIAVPAAAGIPVTHRNLSRNFTVLTGSSFNDFGEENITPIDYQALVKLGGTIVFLMAYHHFEEIINNLLKAGINSKMPCAIISNGCSKKQIVIKDEIENILQRIKNEKIETPAIIVIGETVGLNLNPQIIKKIKIGICGTQNFTKKLITKLTSKNFETVDLSFLDIIVKDKKFPDLKIFKWIIFTSPNGVEQFFTKLKKEKIDLRLLFNIKFAVIGSGSAETLAEYGFYYDFIPTQFDTQTLAKEFIKVADKKDKILICRASNGSRELTDVLNKASYNFTDFHIYELKENKEKIDEISTLKNEYFDVDYLVFGSAMGVETFFKNFQNNLNNKTTFVAIGEKCSEKLKEYGMSNPLIAKKYDIAGIIECIEKDLEQKNDKNKKTKTK